MTAKSSAWKKLQWPSDLVLFIESTGEYPSGIHRKNIFEAHTRGSVVQLLPRL